MPLFCVPEGQMTGREGFPGHNQTLCPRLSALRKSTWADAPNAKDAKLRGVDTYSTLRSMYARELAKPCLASHRRNRSPWKRPKPNWV